MNAYADPVALHVTPEMRELAAEIRALRDAREAVAGSLLATYGRIDGLLLERQERLDDLVRVLLPLRQQERLADLVRAQVGLSTFGCPASQAGRG